MSGEYVDFLERQLKKDTDTIKELTKALKDIAAWGEENGAYWCRETARRALNGDNK